MNLITAVIYAEAASIEIPKRNIEDWSSVLTIIKKWGLDRKSGKFAIVICRDFNSR